MVAVDVKADVFSPNQMAEAVELGGACVRREASHEWEQRTRLG